MHVRMHISALDGKGRVIHDGVYDWSDDGLNFRRANGSIVNLPLTLNPAATHLAESQDPASADPWRLWIGRLRYSGYRVGGAIPRVTRR